MKLISYAAAAMAISYSGVGEAQDLKATYAWIASKVSRHSKYTVEHGTITSHYETTLTEAANCKFVFRDEHNEHNAGKPLRFTVRFTTIPIVKISPELSVCTRS